jgi:hypothetical protein
MSFPTFVAARPQSRRVPLTLRVPQHPDLLAAAAVGPCAGTSCPHRRRTAGGAPGEKSAMRRMNRARSSGSQQGAVDAPLVIVGYDPLAGVQQLEGRAGR